MSVVLVTGANGLLGQSIVAIFTRESDYKIVQTSIENRPFIDYGHKYISLDVTNKEDVKKVVGEIKPAYIINCAAMTNVDQCETEREFCWKLNVDAVKNLIIAARSCDAKIIHYSTDYVFDGRSGPYSEDAVPNPLSFYGRSKLASENALKSSGVNHAIIRTMVLYGIGNEVKSNFVLWLIEQLKKNQPVNIVTDQIGNTTIVDDLAFATLKISEGNKSGVYNVAGSDILSRFDFAVKVCDVFGYKKELVLPIKTASLNQPAPRPLKSGLITLKAQTELGIKFMDSLEGLRLLKVQLGY